MVRRRLKRAMRFQQRGEGVKKKRKNKQKWDFNIANGLYNNIALNIANDLLKKKVKRRKQKGGNFFFIDWNNL